jgi:hypothetical protein
MTQTCNNCQYAEGTYLCSLAGEYRCGYCRTLAKDPGAYRAVKPPAPWKPPKEFTLGGCVMGPITVSLSVSSGPYVAQINDRVRVMEDWGKAAYISTRPQQIGRTGTVVDVDPCLAPIVPGVVLPVTCRYCAIRDDAGTTHYGWYVVEPAP